MEDPVVASYAAAYYNTAILAKKEYFTGFTSGEKTITHNTAMLFASVVNLAFSCEVALKSYIKNPPAGPDGHSLKKLFEMLPAEDQSRYIGNVMDTLRRSEGYEWVKTEKDDEIVFNSLLEAADDNFMSGRYIYEQRKVDQNGKIKGSTVFPHHFLKALAAELLLDYHYEPVGEQGLLEIV